jgi:hypothetical protein
MFLEFIHGLFITYTEFRLSIAFIPVIIIMYVHNWYHSNVSGILCIYGLRLQCTTIHGAFHLLLSPLCLPSAPHSTPFYLLGTLLAVTGSVHLGLRLLVN